MKRTLLPEDNNKSSTAKIDKMLDVPNTKEAVATHTESQVNKNNPIKKAIVKKKISVKKPNPLLPDAYNHRDVLGLKSLQEWTEHETQIHKKFNRILQPGFMHRKADDVVLDAKLTGVGWLTDYCCPSVQSAILLHIAKELVVNYKVNDNELNIKAHHIYESLLKEPNKISELENQVHLIMVDAMKPDGLLNPKNVMERAQKMLASNKIDSPSKKQYQAAIRLILDKEKKILTDQLVSQLVKNHLSHDQTLPKKPKQNIGKSHDYCFLGAAGSGKSTIAKQYLSDEQKTDYAILATDNYRAFTIPNTQAHENLNTKDVFTKTQDIAFMIKELVLSEIESQVKNEKCRPNVICDCIRLESTMRDLLAQGTVTSLVAAFKGVSGFVEIAERADRRARDVTASPADKGRFVQTSALLKGHADASRKLLADIPDKVITTIYDTNVEQGTSPIEIAKVDGQSKTITISNLKVMAEFLNKQNINIEAVNQVDLIYPQNNALNLLATHPENKAKAILDLVSFVQDNKSFTINLVDDNVCYATLMLVDNKISLHIPDHAKFMSKAQSETIEGSLLRAIARQIETGDIKKSVELAFAEGDKPSFMILKLIENQNESQLTTSRKL